MDPNHNYSELSMSTQQSPNTSRPLAPAPPPLGGVLESDNPSSPSATSDTQSIGIKRASTACQSCKQIKRKCDQQKPCSNCRRSHTPCIYNEAEDGRRKAARKRTVESLELKRDALDSILESLRTSSDQNVQALISLIRSNAPLEEVVQYATTHAADISSDQIGNIVSVVDGRPRKTVLSVSDLCDTPLFKVPSEPWTKATTDSEFVSHLISIYFMWFHVAYPVLNKGLFLRDMEAGNPDCEFCTPLLVNAVLSVACQFSSHPRACKMLSDPNTRGRHFLDEATTLWNEQEGRPTLPNIQAASILAVALTLVGKDRMSGFYIEQATVMQQELTLKNAQAEARGTSSVSTLMKHSQNLASWTLFTLAVGFGNAFMKTHSTNLPADEGSIPNPTMEQTTIWFPYPQRSPDTTIAFNDLFRANCKLHKLGFDIQRIHSCKEPTMQKQEVRLLDQKFQAWQRDLPESLWLDSEMSTIRPPVMDLHLVYHWFRVNLYNFVKEPRSNPATPLDELDSFQHHAQDQIIASARSIADLCKRFARDFGLKQPSIWMPQTAISAAYSIIDALSDPLRASQIQDIFHELCLVLVAASRRWLVMKGHVRMLFMTVEEKGHQLPSKTKDLLGFVALDKWGEKDHLQFASASYPNYALAKDEDPRLAAMGDLLERWANFRLQRQEERKVQDSITQNNLSSPAQRSLPTREAGWNNVPTTASRRSENKESI